MSRRSSTTTRRGRAGFAGATAPKRLLVVGFLALVAPASAAAPRILATQDVDPVWSPTGARIAFTRVHATGMTLHVLELATGRSRLVAQNDGKLLPSWSPDGTKLAFQSHGSVWIADAAGRGLDRYASGAFAPAWRPGSQDLAYLSTVGARNLDLWVGRNPAVRWAANAIGIPAWSPDGTAVAFQRDDGLYLVTGPQRERLLVQAANPGPPAWSPDGTQIAYAAQNRVWLVRADGSAAPRPLAIGDGIGTPSWSPRGDALVYARVGGVELTFLNGRSDLLVPIKVGYGGLAEFSPADDDLVAFSGPRPSCPGHRAIRIYADAAHSGPVSGTCDVTGTRRADSIEGTAEPGDVILAGTGNDRVHANDGHTDRVDCGPGYDTVWADRSDRLRGCERIHR
jgi:dipeptidyl aminopeptidase/acylaminoacyl peptidase